MLAFSERTPNAIMGVYARADSRFWWMWLEGTATRTSTRIPIGSRSARTTSRADAEGIYRAAMGDLARGVFRLPTATKARTFREHAAWYRDAVTATHRSAARERSAITRLIDAFGDTLLSQLQTPEIDRWKLARATRVKQSTVNRELEVLKPLLASAVPEFLLHNPASAVRRFRSRYPPIAILTPDAEDAIFAVVSPAGRAFVLLGLDALLRSSDARRLKVEHDHGAHLVLVDTKVETYKVPVSTRLRAALDVLEPKDGFYFPRKYGGKWAPMNPNTAFLLFRAICDRADVPNGRKAGGVTYHALRHTGATRAAKHVKLTAVQGLGGWKSLTQLERYDHPDDPKLVRGVNAIGSRLAHGDGGPVKIAKEVG
jgi:integrase